MKPLLSLLLLSAVCAIGAGLSGCELPSPERVPGGDGGRLAPNAARAAFWGSRSPAATTTSIADSPRNEETASDDIKVCQPVLRELHQVVPGNGVRSVEAHSDMGAVAFQVGKNAGQIDIQASLMLNDDRISEAERRRFSTGFTVNTSTTGDVLHITVEPPADFPRSSSFLISYKILVPPGLAKLEARSLLGEVSAIGTRSDRVSLYSRNRKVIAVNAGLDIDACSDTGAVLVKSDRPMRRVTARNVCGGVQVEGWAANTDASSRNGAVSVRSDISGVGGGKTGRNEIENQHITARSDSGGVSVTESGANAGDSVEAISRSGMVRYHGASPSRLQCHADYGRVFALLEDGGSDRGDLRISVNYGEAELRIPRAARLQIEAHTEIGRVDAQGVEGRSFGASNNSFTATLNHGGGHAVLHCGHGVIRVRPH